MKVNYAIFKIMVLINKYKFKRNKWCIKKNLLYNVHALIYINENTYF